MKKFLILITLLLVGFGGFVIYDTYGNKGIPVLEVEEEVVKIDELYIYGTHLNIHGNLVSGNDLDLVLYNGEFIEIEINRLDGDFNLSDYVNDGLYLDDIPRGEYFLFLRSRETDEDEEVLDRYYRIENTTDYKETTYYTLSNYNNKIVINNEESYPTMKMSVSENTDDDVYDVVIDPGHGGMDGGASRYGYKESDFTMDIALKIKEKLEEYGMKVKLTHEEGQLSSNEKLEEYGVHGRAVVSYEVKAKYLFSVHLNSNGSASVNGLEVYTADNINYDFAKNLANNITSMASLGYSSNKINKVFDGIYTRTFTESDINNSIKDYEAKGLMPYDIRTISNYYYIIRETGGIVTGAYVDNRNSKITGNPYVKSNVGTEAYLLEMGYISNKSNLDNMINNMDKYVDAVVKSVSELYTVNKNLPA